MSSRRRCRGQCAVAGRARCSGTIFLLSVSVRVSVRVCLVSDCARVSLAVVVLVERGEDVEHLVPLIVGQGLVCIVMREGYELRWVVDDGRERERERKEREKEREKNKKRENYLP